MILLGGLWNEGGAFNFFETSIQLILRIGKAFAPELARLFQAFADGSVWSVSPLVYHRGGGGGGGGGGKWVESSF